MLLTITDRGIYCPKADVYIDPWKPVNKALITHAHSDHARRGHKKYLTQNDSLPIVKHRLKNVTIQGIDYNEKININGVKFSFHPAGHIIGSSQIRVEYKGRVEVASGDYKTENDLISGEIEIIKCHHFITESTFGLPVFRWKPQKETFEEINTWWIKNQAEKKVSILTAYSLGKAQRLIRNIDSSIGKIYTHGSIEKINELFRINGHKLPETIYFNPEINPKELIGQMIIAPPSSLNNNWIKKIKRSSVGIASGWMTIRGNRRRRGADKGFVLSDHADWNGLNKVIVETGAEEVTVTHGYTDIFSKWLIEQGIQAYTAETLYTGETLVDSNEEE